MNHLGTITLLLRWIALTPLRLLKGFGLAVVIAFALIWRGLRTRCPWEGEDKQR